jgi:hypothetical protein
MKQLKNLEEIVGKTVERTVNFFNRIFIFFTNSEFIIFDLYNDYDGGTDLIILQEDYNIIPSHSNCFEFATLGIIT